jgi:hypothetical protein
MSGWDYRSVDDLIVTVHKENPLMKKLMSVMLGLAFVLGTTSLFAQDTKDTKPTKEKKQKKSKKTTKSTDAPAK